MTTVIPTTEVKNRFGRVLRQVTQSDNPIIIERDGKPVAVLLSITAWQALHPSANLPAPDADLLEAAFGLWAGRPDIDDEWLTNGRSQWESNWVMADE
ncbi:MAG: type II toxin-antitoxin system Phd/YefM family antitoxin [Anaerolineales bacterium]|nr:type II toxin-antitoxin system Phd/YefM family antitoxin [Anaerolineales bacterium]